MEISIRQLMEAGVHYGHQTHRWNPKMAPYIYGERNGAHLLNLGFTLPMLKVALKKVEDVVAQGGTILFVGTKTQVRPHIKEFAEQCLQFYVNHRWLGGMLTNWQTISQSLGRMEALEKTLASDTTGLVKKELLSIKRRVQKYQRSLGGIRKMKALPNLLIVMDVNKDRIAVKEANKVGIPVVGILDTNSDLEGIDFPVPGNDDVTRSLVLYCNLFARAVLMGLERHIAVSKEQEEQADDASSTQGLPPQETTRVPVVRTGVIPVEVRGGIRRRQTEEKAKGQTEEKDAKED